MNRPYPFEAKAYMAMQDALANSLPRDRIIQAGSDAMDGSGMAKARRDVLAEMIYAARFEVKDGI